jgi:type II secretory pathway component PulF
MPGDTIAANSFAYQAQTLEGLPISGSIDAPDLDQANQLLANLRLRVLQVEPAQAPGRTKPLKGEDFLAFNQQLTQLTAAGLPIEHGLRLIAQDMRSGRLKHTIHEVVAEMEKGTPLGEALEKYRMNFPPLYGQLVTAGVKTKNLSAMLLNLGRHMDLVARVRSMLWRAMSYPIMVLAALALVLVFLGLVVLPQFSSMYKGFGIQLPVATALLLGMSNWVPGLVITIIAIVVLIPLGWQFLRLAGLDRAAVDRLVLPLPLIGPVIKRNLIARWCDAVRLGVQGGMDLPGAIKMAGDAIGSPALMRDGEKMTSALAAGQRLDQMEHTAILPATVSAAISLGSENHDLPAMLATLTEMYQQQAETRLVLIPGVLTPLLIILVAVVIGFVIMALFMPFVTLIRAITG